MAALALFIGAPATACTCTDRFRETPASHEQLLLEAYQKADAVFVGTATSPPHRLVRGWRLMRYILLVWAGRDDSVDREVHAYSRRVRFRLSDRLKGQLPSRVKVLTGWGSGDCGYPFKAGGEYLVFARRTSRGSLYTSICSSTTESADPGDLDLLRSATGQTALQHR